MTRIRWPVALATLFVILLGSYVVYSFEIVRALRSEAGVLTQIYSEIQDALGDTTAARAEDALYRLQTKVIESGVPLILTGPNDDTVLGVQNLGEDVDTNTKQGQARALAIMHDLDAKHPPVAGAGLQHIHYGDTPQVRSLQRIPFLLAGALLLTVFVGFTMIRTQRRAESERAWTSMARELAHQLGTPLSSLQGWLEVLRLPEGERPGSLQESDIADAIQEDLVRLERVSHRFELIGREPELRGVSLHKIVRDLERYLAARLPKLGRGVELILDVPSTLPQVKGNEVLLVWALENVVKNALDALAGRGGRISIYARQMGEGWVSLRIRDTGPGVDPEIRDRIFDPGVTSKSGGWGVGLALSRRIVEGVHQGRIELLDGGDGTTFQIRLPVADA
jgi:signal transduction histidine kinase